MRSLFFAKEEPDENTHLPLISITISPDRLH